LFTLWWTIGVSILITVTALSYLAIDHQSSQLDEAFQGLTDSAGAFFGGTDFFSPVGYLSSQIYYMLLPIMLIIMTLTLVSGLMNRDESDTTVELTLARPISRRQLLLAKAISGLIIVAITCALTLTVTMVAVKVAQIDINYSYLALTHIICFLFALSFGVISFTLLSVSQVTRKIATITAATIGFGGYILTSLAGLVNWLEVPAKLLPYHYYDTASLLTGNINGGLIIYLICIVVIGGVLAAIGYAQRDIN
jgi:ABC-type transport system involved in multi-copper enzyme maturation permease subunit